MNKKKLVIGGALAALATTMVFAEPVPSENSSEVDQNMTHHRPDNGGGQGKKMTHFQVKLQQLDLTVDQQQQVMQILSASHDQMASIMDKMHQTMDQIRHLSGQDYDAVKAHELSSQLGDLVAQKTELHLQTTQNIITNVLSQEQVQQLQMLSAKVTSPQPGDA